MKLLALLQEFVGLKPKIYSFLLGNNTEHKKAKDMKKLLLQQ